MADASKKRKPARPTKVKARAPASKRKARSTRRRDAFAVVLTRARRDLSREERRKLAKAIGVALDHEVERKRGAFAELPPGMAKAARVSVLAKLFGASDATPEELGALDAAYTALTGATGKSLVRAYNHVASVLVENEGRERATLLPLLAGLEPFDPAFTVRKLSDVSDVPQDILTALARYSRQGGRGLRGPEHLLANLVVWCGAFGETQLPSWSAAVDRVCVRIRTARGNYSKARKG